jgi:purine-binding chemotaxis protein CheW
VEVDTVLKMVVPEWANQPFQTLFFTVRGMTLGIPLVELNSIAESNYELTSLPGQPDWHLGVAVHRDQRIVVVDTAQLIAPERLAAAKDVNTKGSHILIVGDGRFGLACDSIKSPQALDKDSVRWRKGAGWQPWMAGTVIDQLCILLDVGALLEMVGHK